MKTPEPQKGNPSAPSSADSTGPTVKLTPRQPCKPGYYALSPQGRERAVALLGGGRHA